MKDHIYAPYFWVLLDYILIRTPSMCFNNFKEKMSLVSSMVLPKTQELVWHSVYLPVAYLPIPCPVEIALLPRESGQGFSLCLCVLQVEYGKVPEETSL